jgi:hypothetical protein
MQNFRRLLIMKKILSVALISALMLMLASFAVYADTVTITVDDVTAEAGEQSVAVEVSIDGFDSSSDTFGDLSLQFSYDDTVLTLDDYDLADAKYLDSKSKKKTASAETGEDDNPFVVNWGRPEGAFFDDEVIITLYFNVDENATAGKYDIDVDFFHGRDGDYTDGVDCNYDKSNVALSLEYVDGSITIEGDTPTTNTITVSAAGKSAVFETEEAISGTVLVGLYDGNRLIEVYTYDAAAEIAPVFTADTAGKTIKALWWENLTTVKPLSAAKVLE